MTTRSLRLLSALFALSLLTACGETNDKADAGTKPQADAGQISDSGVDIPPHDAGTGHDAGENDAGTGAPDAGPIDSCDDIGADNCLSNLDCAANEVCGELGEDMAFGCCVLGTRGQGEAGEACTSGADCAIGLCLERDDGAMFCSGECEGSLDCPVTMYCGNFFGWCVPRDTDEPIEGCWQLYLDQCFENDNCPPAGRCENLGTEENEVFCCTRGDRGTKGVGEACASGLECEYGRCLGGLCSAACDFNNDPCPEETMYCSTITMRCEPL
ncbi:MAG: hypothetical protein ACOX6T_24955 [Myxococcales bacterium]|jgi:hypothetical protein